MIHDGTRSKQIPVTYTDVNKFSARTRHADWFHPVSSSHVTMTSRSHAHASHYPGPRDRISGTVNPPAESHDDDVRGRDDRHAPRFQPVSSSHVIDVTLPHHNPMARSSAPNFGTCQSYQRCEFS